ncbi:MAG: sugar phosphate isomerase/epimerase [Clostridia bacterium]|nr:sugar phosphate isomerase/epimerase [Clostridia bacterium]
MDTLGFASKLHISSIDRECRIKALRYGLGIENAEFCWAYYLDNGREERIKASMDMIGSVERLWFHAPFAELCACAIDPKAKELARLRYKESIDTAAKLGIKNLVIHGGYIPYVYYPETYVDGSVEFWRAFLADCPKDMNIAIENVMEPDPDMLVKIARGVNDKRFGLCLDAGHANTEISKLPPVEWIAPMAKFIKHFHLHNNYGERDLHNCLPDGTIDFDRFLTEAQRLCPEASYTLENMDCSGSLDWLVSRGLIGRV